MNLQAIGLTILSASLLFCACDYVNTQSNVKVIGGQDFQAQEFSSALRFARVPCSATKIATTQILTAAHCVVMDEQSSKLRNEFRPGAKLALDQGYSPNGSVDVTIQATDLHPDWIAYAAEISALRKKGQSDEDIFNFMETAESGTADLAIITVSGEIPGTAAAIGLQSLKEKDHLTLVGAGCTAMGGDLDGKLRQVTLTVDALTSAMITTKPGSKGHEISACGGDSGGGAYQHRDGGHPVVVGVSSYIQPNAWNDPTGIRSFLSRLDQKNTRTWLDEVRAADVTLLDDVAE